MAVDGGDALVCLSSDPCLNVLRPKLSATTSKAAALPRIIIQRAPFCLEKRFGAMTLMRHSFIEKCRKRASYTKFLTGPGNLKAPGADEAFNSP